MKRLITGLCALTLTVLGCSAIKNITSGNGSVADVLALLQGLETSAQTCIIAATAAGQADVAAMCQASLAAIQAEMVLVQAGNTSNAATVIAQAQAVENNASVKSMAKQGLQKLAPPKPTSWVPSPRITLDASGRS